MAKGLSRRAFLVTATAAGGARILSPLVARVGGKRVLTLVWDKTAGAMRAVDRLVR